MTKKSSYYQHKEEASIIPDSTVTRHFNSRCDMIENSKMIFDIQIMNLEQLCTLLGVAKQTIYNKVSKGEIPYRKRCGKLYFLVSEIENWIEEGD